MRRFVLALALVAACSGDDDDDEAAPDAALDATVADAEALPDAFVPCPGELLFTGDYVEWDSTDTMFMGIAFATVSEVGNPENTATTAPNGRVVLCLTPGEDADIGFTQIDHMPLRFVADADVVAKGAFTARGLTMDRADTLLDAFGVFRDPKSSIVVVDLGVSGGSVELTQPTYEAAVNVLDDKATLFANVDSFDVPAAVNVTAPAGMTCDGRTDAELFGGRITWVQWACE